MFIKGWRCLEKGWKWSDTFMFDVEMHKFTQFLWHILNKKIALYKISLYNFPSAYTASWRFPQKTLKVETYSQRLENHL